MCGSIRSEHPKSTPFSYKTTALWSSSPPRHVIRSLPLLFKYYSPSYLHPIETLTSCLFWKWNTLGETRISNYGNRITTLPSATHTKPHFQLRRDHNCIGLQLCPCHISSSLPQIHHPSTIQSHKCLLIKQHTTLEGRKFCGNEGRRRGGRGGEEEKVVQGLV
ncbi:hypothetical protein VIGAN_04001300 [Vigna angularis var. angularis]|uniref:Uncharacterized protein n=1 Tax=Vigna angularis var. angularis TaxID=157739 RepID=A0A0S3RQQ1_PHAAN|nr:hypothetical protein VIGAN_04001300 [Vigna angularis var. angularis]